MILMGTRYILLSLCPLDALDKGATVIGNVAQRHATAAQVILYHYPR